MVARRKRRRRKRTDMASKKKGKGKKPKVKKKQEPKGLTLEDVRMMLTDEFEGAILEFGIRDKKRTKYLEFSVQREKVLPISKFLHGNGFEHCSMISAVDWKDRFEVVYHISSYRYNLMLQMTAQVPRDDPQVESVSNIWGGANWHEREAWDLMGIKFIDHPDLRRVLLPDDWVGHPLRKDYKEVE